MMAMRTARLDGGEVNFSIHCPVYDITTATRARLLATRLRPIYLIKSELLRPALGNSSESRGNEQLTAGGERI